MQPIRYDTTDELYIQPIQVCDDNGNACARVNFFEEITAQILAQAQIKLSFLPINRLNSTRFLSIDDRNSGSTSSEFYELTRMGGAGAFGRNPNSTNSSGPINLWFVDEIKAGGGVQFGMAWVGANGVIISEAVLDYNRGAGRMDTIAHEIGHNLGLRHTTLGGGEANNLMTDGNGRQTPRSVADVGAHGGGISLLTDAQIEAIRASSFVNRNSLPQADSIASVSPDEGAALLSRLSALALGSSSEAGTLTTFVMDASRSAAATPSAAAKVPEPTVSWISLSAIGLLLMVNRRALSCRP